MSIIGRSILGSFERSAELEWIVTNGLGGFACSTAACINTRRYHGVLVASINPPVERVVLVSRISETLVVDGCEINLSTWKQQKKVVYPAGHLYLENFSRFPVPTWTYQIKDILLIKSLCMPAGQNSTLLTYKLIGGHNSVELRLRPHLLFRGFHGNMYENPGFENTTKLVDNSFSIKPFANAPTLFTAWDRGNFILDEKWFRNIYLLSENERGLNPLEDDFSNGYLSVDKFSGSVSIIFSDQPVISFNPIDLRKKEENRIESIASSMTSDDALLRRLLIAADQFIVERRNTGGKTIIAGYPWFADWGRDSLIALPGLTLIPGRIDDAKSILQTFARSIYKGLVPNCFSDHGKDAAYNTVDASLWLFYAAYKFIEYTDDYSFVKDVLYEPLMSVFEAYASGTLYGIAMDPDDGLICAGQEGLQLTWMDAKVDEWVVTPRHGKAVEINALWYNALKILEMLHDKFDGDSREVTSLARLAKASFRRKFYDPELRYLYDCILPDGTIDASFRPNQIFAVYLPFSLLDAPREKEVVEAVFKKLYSSYGLRSLDPGDPRYQGNYSGDRRHRDSAYHQGTVWAYLIGPFISSYLKVNNFSIESQLRASHMIEPFANHLAQEGGIGSISEIFDGDPPHRAQGCFAQAWSVAELLRCYVEDIKGQKPTLIV